ncbi:MAG: protein kinase, partial [Chlorobium sp.]|nr:protein kinase [Chlorobium sp.]
TDLAECDQLSDIYSFGVVLYQMISGGVLPFDTDNKNNYCQIMKYKHLTDNIPRLDSPLFPLIESCMQKERNVRIDSFYNIRIILEDHLLTMFNDKVGCVKLD